MILCEDFHSHTIFDDTQKENVRKLIDKEDSTQWVAGSAPFRITRRRTAWSEIWDTLYLLNISKRVK